MGPVSVREINIFKPKATQHTLALLVKVDFTLKQQAKIHLAQSLTTLALLAQLLGRFGTRVSIRVTAKQDLFLKYLHV